jgi:hypothetical protein
MRFRLGTDYKTEFNNAVTAIVTKKIADRVERMSVIESIINEYFEATGELPEQIQLERLTDAILMEELTDPSRDKSKNTEYPFLSEWQFDRRRDGEVKIEAADAKYQPPTKRKKPVWEQIWIDQHAKIRNKERKEQYRKDSSASDVWSWKSDKVAIEQHLVETYGTHKLRYSR